MNKDFQNKNLFNEKKNLIGSLDYKNLELQNTLTCLYHGIPLKISCKEKDLIEKLESDLPNSWQVELDEYFHIYLVDPREKGIDLEAWCDEASQDCFYLNEGKVAIQRDFASREVDEKHIVLITENSLCDGLYNFFRWFLPRKLLAKGSYILHSSCIIGHDNKALIFLGHSGAGKTTISGLADGRKILGDDMNLIRVEDHKIYAQAGAIGGFFKSDVDYDKSFEVKAFYWLEKSPNIGLDKLSLATSLSKLMASYANLFWESLDKADTDRIFTLSKKLVQNYPVYNLSFTKDKNFWELIDES